MNIVPCGYSSLLINDLFDSFDFVGIICVWIKESCVTYMTERVYRLKTEKFDLILTTINDISDFNHEYIRFEGSVDYTDKIAFAKRSCAGFPTLQGWSYISKDALDACDKCDDLKSAPQNSFLLHGEYAPLNLKIAALRIMVNNFSVDPSDNDKHYWTFVNDQLKISDAADENPVENTRRRRNPQNPIRRDDTHNGNRGDPNHGHADITDPDDMEAMLSQLEHYI